MHRSIGVTLLLIASVLIPRQARSVEPVTITLAVATIIGGVAGASDLKDRVEVWTGLVESDGSKLDRIFDKDFLAARSFMEQYENTPKNKELLKLARTRFTDAAAGYEGRLDGTTMYKRALALLGLTLCCDAINDQPNAQMALVKITKIGMIPESALAKRGPDYLKYLAVCEEVMAKLIKGGVYKRHDIFEKANKLLLGKEGTPQDHTAGFMLMRLAAKHGAVSAQYNVGKLYEDGVGVRRNYSEAVNWYRRAAEQGHRRAQSGLGHLYLNGRGVPKDVVEGAAWVGVSSMNEVQEYNIRISGATLSSGDKIKLKKRVSELFEKYRDGK